MTVSTHYLLDVTIWYCLHVGRKAIQVGDLSTEIAKFLEMARKEQRVSYRDLETQIGINYMRAQRILKAERPFTVDEVNLISAALGFIGWKVVRDAARRSHPAPSLAPNPGEESPMPTEDKLPVAQNSGDHLPTLDPEAVGLAASRDTRQENSEQGNDQSEVLGAP